MGSIFIYLLLEEKLQVNALSNILKQMKYYHSSFRLISLILSTCHYLSCSNIRIAHGFVLVPVKTSSLKTLSIKNVQTKKVNNPLPSILENDKRGGAILAWPLTKDPKGMAPDFPLTITI